MTRSEKVEFKGVGGDLLAARLDLPAGEPRAHAIFAHCFTCGKDIFAAKRIAEGLTGLGFAVLRFDFTGLGASEGEFANTNFSSNVGDLVQAAAFLRAAREAPTILIGHSLGGAAVLAAAGEIPEVKAVATIGAPSDLSHVARLFTEARPEIEAKGEAEVMLAGRRFRIQKQFLDDIEHHHLAAVIGKMRKALLIFHSPIDSIVGIDNAAAIFAAAKHPKSFVSLDDADHLLSRRADAIHVATVLAAWAGRYLPVPPKQEEAPADEGVVTVRETGGGKFQNEVLAAPHRMLADEPASAGGDATGPTPYDYLLAGLGACTAMTLRLYAERKQWPLARTTVRLRHEKMHAEDCADCETREGKIDRIERELILEGELDAEQRARLAEIADKCPVHRTLRSEVKIVTTLRA
jgi:putative redox protein